MRGFGLGLGSAFKGATRQRRVGGRPNGVGRSSRGSGPARSTNHALRRSTFARAASNAVTLGTVCLFGMGGSASAAKMGSWPPEGNTYPFATFAAGCFWGVELRFQRIPGVIKTAVGYIDGDVSDPKYEAVCTGMTGHTEAVQMTYDPKVVSFEELCDVFYAGHNPTQLNRQGNDMGTQYRSGIYYHDDAQKKIAEEKKAGVVNAVTEIKEAKTFWPAEEYHQQYLEKGGRFKNGQSAAKGCTDPIRCYG